MKLTFWGAAETVTGSMHEIGVGSGTFLLDCGTYQGRRHESRERNSHLPFPASNIDAVLLSHAHLDHSGNLPTLVKNGFSGPIYSTPATVDLLDPLLRDSANIQDRDAAYVNKRAWRRKALLGKENADQEVQPIYTEEDVEATLPLLRRVLLQTPTEVADGVTYETVDAGHMLGSTSIVLEARSKGQTTRLGFSGDIGRRNLPITPDPDIFPPVDYLIMESTYGDRLHKDIGRVQDKLADVVNRTCQRGGKLIVPAFALGRAQQLIILLHELMDAKRISSIPIFVDSPLAVKTTQVYRAHQEAYDAETHSYSARGVDPFSFDRLRYIQDVGESKALNDLRGPMMIISSSGMCEAGRILHHLRNNIENPRNTVLITGFQAQGTLGRRILEKQSEVPIFGDTFRLRAEVVKLNELSGHADQREMLTWLKPAATAGLKKVFLVHGEPAAQKALAAAIEETYGIPVVIPARGESHSL